MGGEPGEEPCALPVEQGSFQVGFLRALLAAATGKEPYTRAWVRKAATAATAAAAAAAVTRLMSNLALPSRGVALPCELHPPLFLRVGYAVFGINCSFKALGLPGVPAQSAKRSAGTALKQLKSLQQAPCPGSL